MEKEITKIIIIDIQKSMLERELYVSIFLSSILNLVAEGDDKNDVK